MKSRQDLIKELDSVFSIYIRQRDADDDGYIECYCCGRKVFWKYAQNMHYIPRQHMSLRYNELNCHSGCEDCNEYKDGNLQAYENHLIADYGITEVNELKRLKNDIMKWPKHALEETIKYYKRKIKELENGK